MLPGYMFDPSSLTLRKGDSVLVTDKDSMSHTFDITALGVKSGNMDQNATFRYHFSTTGTFTFFCEYHTLENMKGTVKVTA